MSVRFIPLALGWYLEWALIGTRMVVFLLTLVHEFVLYWS